MSANQLRRSTETRTPTSSRRKALLRAAVFGTLGVGFASPAAAQLCTVPIAGQVTCPGGDPNVVGDIVGGATPIVVTLGDNFDTLTTLRVTSLLGGDITIEPVTTAIIQTANEPGLLVDSGGDINARITTILTDGDGATGALLRAVDDVVFIVDDTVATTGDLADGVNIEGRSVDVTLNQVRTEGEDSDGVELVSLDGPVNLDADLIETTGGLSAATIVRAVGDANINVGALRTGGDQAVGADISNDAAACVLLGAGGCDTSLTADEITTNGFGSIGALVSAAGDTDIDIGVLQTNGDEAAGLDLSADPTACVALGVGACDTAFTVDNLTTNGARAPGAIVRAVGDIDANVGVLRTNGEDSVGLDLASDPNACVLLGAGACGTSFNVGQLTTNGDGATGVLARIVGPTTGNVTLLNTVGDDATGVDIAADPTACVLLGIGQCDVDFTGGQIGTLGDGSGGVLINTPANVLATLGIVSTEGNDAPAITIVTDPAICLLLGAAACSVDLDAGDVDTGGDDSPGIDITSPGPITVDAGDVDTDGDDSPGIIIVGGPGPIDVDVDNVNTDGDNSPGIDVTGTGPIDIDAGTVTTGGDNSDGITVDGGEGPITVDFDTIVTTGDNSDGVDVSGTGTIDINGGTVTTSGAGSDGIVVVGADDLVTVDTTGVTTTGPNADGVVVTTTTGNQVINAGPVTVTGAGSDAIVANAACATLSITATGPITSAGGIGIDANSACAVNVTTLGGAPVAGSLAGIDVTSGTGATILIGDRVSSANGPALNVDGAAANVTIGAGGTLAGRFDLTDANDVLVNNGRIEATGTSSFGGGTDSFRNNGTLAIAPGATVFTGLESTVNAGGLELRNGSIGDTLTLSGTYTGNGNAYLGVDVNPAAGTGDRLVIGGAATGSTTVLINALGAAPGTLVDNLIVVDAGAGTSATAFTLPGGTVTRDFIDYSLVFDPAGQNFALVGAPNDVAFQQSKLGEGSRQIFYRGNDAVGDHLTDVGNGAGADTRNERSSALWMVTFGHYNEYDRTSDFSSLGQVTPVALDYAQDIFGIQVGYDVGGVGGEGSVVGVTGGYSTSVLRFDATGDRFDYQSANVGVYGRFDLGMLYVNGIARYEWNWIDAISPTTAFRADLNGNSWGGKLEAGARLGSGGFFVEPSASIEYVRTDIDGFSAYNSTFDFDNADGLRGKAGARIGVDTTGGPNPMTFYLGGYVVHEFEGDDAFTFTNNGTSLGYAGPRIGTYGQAKLGFSARMGSSVSGFIEANAEYGDDYQGYGGRAGISIRF